MDFFDPPLAENDRRSHAAGARTQGDLLLPPSPEFPALRAAGSGAGYAGCIRSRFSHVPLGGMA